MTYNHRIVQSINLPLLPPFSHLLFLFQLLQLIDQNDLNFPVEMTLIKFSNECSRAKPNVSCTGLSGIWQCPSLPVGNALFLTSGTPCSHLLTISFPLLLVSLLQPTHQDWRESQSTLPPVFFSLYIL